jgi:hypothetical protein
MPRASIAIGQSISNVVDFLKPLSPSLVDCVCPSNGAHSMMRKTPQANHLSDRIKAARDEAARLPAGPEKDALLGQAEPDEVALRVMTSSGHLAPPSDLLPVKRHPLRRK